MATAHGTILLCNACRGTAYSSTMKGLACRGTALGRSKERNSRHFWGGQRRGTAGTSGEVKGEEQQALVLALHLHLGSVHTSSQDTIRRIIRPMVAQMRSHSMAMPIRSKEYSDMAGGAHQGGTSRAHRTIWGLINCKHTGMLAALCWGDADSPLLGGPVQPVRGPHH